MIVISYFEYLVKWLRDNLLLSLGFNMMEFVRMFCYVFILVNLKMGD